MLNQSEFLWNFRFWELTFLLKKLNLVYVSVKFIGEFRSRDIPLTLALIFFGQLWFLNPQAIFPSFQAYHFQPRPSSQISESSDIATGRVKSVVGRDFIRFSKYTKVGAEDFIIGQVSKKCDKVLYRIIDQGSGVQWEGGMNATLTCHVAKPEEKRKFAGNQG